MASGIADDIYQQLLALLRAGRLDELAARSQDLAQTHPDDGRVWQMLGVAHLSAGHDREAVEPLRLACAKLPDNSAVWDNLGLTYHRLGDYDQADACFRRSTDLQPDRLTAWLNWSVSACMGGYARDAEQYARRSLQLNPRQADAWLNLGNALLDLNLLAEADAAYRQALDLRPDLAEATLSHALLLERQGRLPEAIGSFEKFVRARPKDWRGHAGLGQIYSALGRADLASANYRRAVGCDRSVAVAFSGLLFLRLYEEGADSASVFQEHRAFGMALDARYAGQRPILGNDRDPDRRLRIGFVSGDFRGHAVAHFFEPFLAALDRERFTAVLYSTHQAEDEVTRRLQQSADLWVSVARMNDEHMAARVQADAIDILIDLSGHSSYNRLPVFARKPAPVQVSWLGYPSTTGLSSIDYRPVYAMTAFPGMAEQFTENLVYLPCAPSFRHPPEAPDVGPLPALRRGGITFASLNRTNKLGASVVRTWARILHALPDARLMLGAVSEAAVRADLTARFVGEGVAVERLLFRPRLPMRDYLELHNEIDVLLDPFPFSGLTTSEHAVWMGVPVLTLAGDALVKRQGIVIMESLGLEDWVVEDEAAYVRKALAVAGDLGALAALRAGLRRRLLDGPLGQPALEARCMARALREMWRRWCAGQPPASFHVAPDVVPGAGDEN
jgi:predicted O-linked N-acetylglucosamine transferase (SPINDLY family)